VLIRGVLAVVFGLYALFAPASALLALVFVFGFYAIMDGVAALVVGFRHRRTSHWGWHVAQGVVSLIAGLIALFWPGPTLLALVFIIAVWSIVLGVAIAVPALVPVLDRWSRHLEGSVYGWQGAADDLKRALVMIAFLPHQAWLSADAIVRVCHRKGFSKLNLLEWKTADAADQADRFPPAAAASASDQRLPRDASPVTVAIR